MAKIFKHFKNRWFFAFLFLSFIVQANGQACSSNVEVAEFLAARENGPVDFTIIGDSQNPFENNKVGDPGNGCNNLFPITNTSASLALPPGTQIRTAYLYWSGTGEPDQSVVLNGNPISSDRCWSFDYNQNGTPFTFFGAMTDVSTFVRNTGNGVYTFSGLDNSSWYTTHQCSGGGPSSLLYGGWALVVVFEDPSFNNNTVFIYDGFKNFDNSQFQVNIQTNVFDDFLGSHVGLVAWEGDDFINDPANVDEFKLNGTILPSPAGAYTNATNIFNGTDSFESPADNTFFNGDIDDFDASNQVQALLNTPAANFNFSLSSGQDFIILNTLVMRLPNEAPDALVDLPQTIELECDQRTFEMDFTYSNDEDASRDLPTGTPISFYLNEIGGSLVGSTDTTVELAPGEEAPGTVSITLPSDYVGDFEIFGYIDDPSLSVENYGTILELFETNNTNSTTGFVDQEYIDLDVPLDLCEGERFIMGDGTVVTETGNYDFDDKTVRGGCDSTGVLRVIVRPSWEITNDLVELCEGDSFTRPNGQSLTLEPRDTPYEFTDQLFTKTYGCDSIVHSSFLVKPHERATFEREICLGDSFEVGEGEFVFESGVYEVTKGGAATNGCDSIVTYNLDVLDVLYPNAFGPDGNGANDGFKAILPEICPDFIADYTLKIYNRWGQLVFESNDVNEPWDGVFEEELSDANYYLWYAEYTTTAEKLIKKEGGVTLIR